MTMMTEQTDIADTNTHVLILWHNTTTECLILSVQKNNLNSNDVSRDQYINIKKGVY